MSKTKYDILIEYEKVKNITKHVSTKIGIIHKDLDSVIGLC